MFVPNDMEMEQNSFRKGIAVNMGAGEVISRIGNVTGWWGVSCSGSTERPGDAFVIRMGGDSFFNCTVAELVPGRRLVWLVTDCNMPWYSDRKEWKGTRMIFDLQAHGGGTKVTFTHEGLTADVECYRDCAAGWSHWIGTSLAAYLDTGKGNFVQPR
jgi:uncharacterized protein YndB with AHSA1/START domain